MSRYHVIDRRSGVIVAEFDKTALLAVVAFLLGALIF